MYAWGDSELPQEEIDRIIHSIAKKIHMYGMDTPAIIALESFKPLANMGGELSRMLFSPFLPILGPEYNMLGDKLIYIFHERKNLEKLISLLEEMSREDEEKKKLEKKKPDEETEKDSTS